MTDKKKIGKGRKHLPTEDLKRPITVFVKSKYHKFAAEKIKDIARKYNTK